MKSLSPYSLRYALPFRFNIQHIDPLLMLLLLLLLSVGLFIFYSAADQNMRLIKSQVIHMIIALSVMLMVAQCSPEALKRWAPFIYCIGLGLLILVIFAGDSSKGAQRWLDFGIIRFQPSELMKIATPLMLASYLDSKVLPIRWKDICISSVIIAMPVSLIILQPDLGTSLLILLVGLFCIYFAGVSFKLIFAFATLVAACIPMLWVFMHDYQRKRVLTFLNPENDPLGSGYHIIQSKIALGSGGLLGKGWLQGTQTQLDFLPEQKTDFIFSVFGEEFGFIGVVVLLLIYLALIARGLYIGAHAQDTFSRLLAGSLMAIFLVYIVVNIGMTCGLLPVVGVPLPLVSYGGTSMVTIMIGFGIVMSINSHRRLLPK